MCLSLIISCICGQVIKSYFLTTNQTINVLTKADNWVRVMYLNVKKHFQCNFLKIMFPVILFAFFDLSRRFCLSRKQIFSVYQGTE